MIIGPFIKSGKLAVGKKLIDAGTKFDVKAFVAKAPSPASKSIIGKQSVTIVGASGNFVVLGGSQVIRYGIENGINSVTQPNHV